MRKSHSKDVKSLFGSLFSHEHSGTPPSRLPQTAMQPASKLETGLNAASASLQLAKDVGEAASQVPYVKAVAGVLFQIIRIREVSCLFPSNMFVSKRQFV